jgi:hypothetical protein
MIYYELHDCSDKFVPNVWTDSDLAAAGLTIGSFFQVEEYPGFCWEIVSAPDLPSPPPAFETMTVTDSNFVNCTQCLASIIPGCMDPLACNYNPCATVDDGSCFYNNVTIRILCNGPITTCNIDANCD